MDANEALAMARLRYLECRSALAVGARRTTFRIETVESSALEAPAVAQFLGVPSRRSIDGYPSIIDAMDAFARACHRYEASKASASITDCASSKYDKCRSAAPIRIDDERKRRTQAETDEAFSALDTSDLLSNFITYAVAQFLGVRSLLSFGATCKSHRSVVSKEIERRKACIEEICIEVRRLMVLQNQSADLVQYIERNAGDAIQFKRGGLTTLLTPRDTGERDNEEVDVRNPTRENVIAAKSMAYFGVRLIDDELYTIHKKGTEISSPAACWDRNDFGKDQRIFRDTSLECQNQTVNIFRQEKCALKSLHILPDCFYFPHEGEVRTLSRGAIRKACRYVTMVFTAHLGEKAGTPVKDRYGCYLLTGSLLAQEGIIDAFRVAAREYIFFVSELRGCFRETINKADNFKFNGSPPLLPLLASAYDNCHTRLPVWSWILYGDDDDDNFNDDDDDDNFNDDDDDDDDDDDVIDEYDHDFDYYNNHDYHEDDSDDDDD